MFALIAVALYAPHLPGRWMLTPDSAHYLLIADHLRETGQLADPLGYLGQPVPQPALYWPPGLPLLLALGGALGLSWPTLSVLVPLAGAAAVGALGAWHAGRTLRGIGTWLLALAIVASPALGRCAVNLWSEAPATAAALAALWAMERLDNTPSARRAVIAGLWVGVAMSLRWTGAASLAPLALVLVSHRAPIAAAGIAGLSAVVLPLIAWQTAVGSPPRLDATAPIAAFLGAATGGIGKVWLGLTLWGGLLPVLLAASHDGPPPDTRPLLRHAVLVLAHTALLGAGAFVALDTVDLRLLLPVTPSVLLLAAGLAAQRPWPRPRAFMLAATALVLLAPVLSGWSVGPKRASRWEAAAAHTPTLAALPEETTLFTDVPELAPTAPHLRWITLQTVPNASWEEPPAGALALRHRPGSDCPGEVCLEGSPTVP